MNKVDFENRDNEIARLLEHKKVDAQTIQEQSDLIVVLEKALELACLVISKAMCPNGNWETLKIDFANAYKEQAKEMMKSE